MRHPTAAAFLGGVLLASLIWVSMGAAPAQQDPQPDPAAMAAMMAKAEKLTKPGPKLTCPVSSMDTAMLHAEGDVDPRSGALISYGTLDEYLTGEHDKMVRYVWRFSAESEMVLEVHDLAIGESNTQVVEIRFRKRDA